MGELLYQKWLEGLEDIDIQTAMLHTGIDGLLYEFEVWLRMNGYMKDERCREQE